jgi:hypothetical protein
VQEGPKARFRRLVGRARGGFGHAPLGLGEHDVQDQGVEFGLAPEIVGDGVVVGALGRRHISRTVAAL